MKRLPQCKCWIKLWLVGCTDYRDTPGGEGDSHFPQSSLKLNSCTRSFTNGKLQAGERNGKEKSFGASVDIK